MTPGYYYWNGSKWIKWISNTDGWKTLGNTLTNPAVHFLGTIDNVDLSFRTFNIIKSKVTTRGQIAQYNMGNSLHFGNGDANDNLANNEMITIGFNVNYNVGSQRVLMIGNQSGVNSGNNAISIGDSSRATQVNTIGFGYRARAFQGGAIALGCYSNSNGAGALAMGINARTSALNCTAIGENANSSSTSSNAIGLNAVCSGNNGLALGTSTTASGSGSTALGLNTLSINFGAAVGTGASVTGTRSTAIGNGASTTMQNSIAIGNGASVTIGNSSTAIGASSVVTAANTIRFGNTTTTTIGGAVNWSVISDKNLKKTIEENVIGTAFIKQLLPVTYMYDVTKLANFFNVNDSTLSSKDITYSGFLAQDVEASAINVGYDFNGIEKPANDQSIYGLRYETFVVPIVKTIQEQQEKIDELKAKIILLKELNAQLKNKSSN